MKFLLGVLSKASEFETIPIRSGEASILSSLNNFLTYPLEPSEEHKEVSYNSPESKTNILL
jgi:hypothetical protein